MKNGFSLISLALCLGIILDVNAAPSVRVLGSNAGYSAGTKPASEQNVSAVKTGNTISSSVLGANAGAKKSASIKTVSPKASVITPVARAASSRAGSIVPTKAAVAKTGASAERFPGIATKTNVQSIGKTGTIATTGKQTAGTGYDVRDMSDRLSAMEETVSNKVNSADLDNYYTKGEIEDIRDDYYTAAEVEDRIAEMDTSASSEYIRNLTVQVRSNLEQIQNISAAVDGMATQHLVSQFDESILGED